MELLIVTLILGISVFLYLKKRNKKPDLSILPEQFIVFDLETTGLKPELHEIIEIGAIRVNRDSNKHDTFQTLVLPKKKIPAKITEITGITNEMVEKDGVNLDSAISQFLGFIGGLPLVSYNSEFDMSFLLEAFKKTNSNEFQNNRVSCALKMARRAWPGLKSYRLPDLAKAGNLSSEGTHRALGDCQRAMLVYTTAAVKLKSPI